VTDVLHDPSLEYAVAAAERRDERTRVLKHGDTFGVFDAFGDAGGLPLHEQGLYHRGTRHLSTYELRLAGGHRFLLLSSTLQDSSDVLTVDLTNPELHAGGEPFWPQGLLHVHRSRFLWEGTCYERIALSNFGSDRCEMVFELNVDADFADIFEVRGTPRRRRGHRLPPEPAPDGLVFRYEGLDGVARRTVLVCEPAPQHAGGRLRFVLRADPRQTDAVIVAIACDGSPRAPLSQAWDAALAEATQAGVLSRGRIARVETSSDRFDRWMHRSAADVSMMVTETPHGPYPYAGIPWFSTVFGRDGLICALAMLWADPSLARGVLQHLAATQATGLDPARDAQPGKILHEARDSEMAALGDVPFGRYYGSVDSTPLFVLLAGRYLERTGDVAFARAIWPHVQAALRWIDEFGDVDGDGFIEYARATGRGLANQGWKDSHDAVFHRDGTPAEGPIALCEVQGYVYAARQHAAAIASACGEAARGRALLRQADALRREFERRFWLEPLGTYALALDGRKRPCEVVSSNAGQVLLSGIPSRERAARVAASLMTPEMFSGWGIRTVADREARYNPMSYHNGSIWPHDCALIALGLSRYGFKDEVVRIAAALLDASLHFDLRRLPELFCGFRRRTGEGPTRYPVACSPQAWAASAPYLLVQALLGLAVDGARRRVVFHLPQLPDALDWLRLTGIDVGGAKLDVLCERRGRDVGISVLRRSGDVSVATER
jgi:glycogen debranching enzyme